MKNNDRDKFDDLIDTALSSYADAEPLSGLEQRILRRVQLVKDRRRRFISLKWALALATLASVLLVGVNLPKNYEDPAPKTISTARSADMHAAVPFERSPRTLAEKPQVTPKHRANAARRQSLASKSLPKQRQFPSVVSLSEDESALLAFAERDPEQALEAFRDLQNRSNEEIKIPEIVIPPLRQGDGVE